MPPLSIGDRAPDFELEALDGTRFALSERRGRDVLIAFLRNARCAVCNLWVHETAERSIGWRARGLEVVAVFESSADTLRAAFGAHTPPFAVLADPDGAVHARFGSDVDPEAVQALVASGEAEGALARAAAAGFSPVVEEGANFFRIPAEVLIDRDGRVALFHRADRVTNHLDPERIERYLLDR